MIAKVLVDIPTYHTNQLYDYKIPKELETWIEPGCRVSVPFGKRTIQGFVFDITQKTDVPLTKLKAILQILDLMPPLTQELLQLSHWLCERYICPQTIALQAMLPTALKAKAERVVELNHSQLDNIVDEELTNYLMTNGATKWEDLTKKFPNKERVLKKMLHENQLLVNVSMKDKVNMKKEKWVHCIPQEEWLADLKRAPKQRVVIERFLTHTAPIEMQKLVIELNIQPTIIQALEKKGYIQIELRESYRDPYAHRNFVSDQPLALTPEQQKVYETILQSMNQCRHQSYLLHGVTGSGKTEIYLQTIAHCLDQKKSAIVLVPEISLTPQMVERFKMRFADQVAVMHSRMSQGERYDEWRKIRQGKVKIAVGARSAIFAPFENIGLIIIDEEHEGSYKQEESPKYHAKEVAMERGKAHQAVVLLGSATPSVESYYESVKVKKMKYLTMPTRVQNRAMPEIEIVDLREELRAGNRSMFSRALTTKIEECLLRAHQIILLLNRRGYSTFVMCRSCGLVVECPECEVSLTYHKNIQHLRCHYCGYTEMVPEACPSCESPHIRFFGTGTQRVEDELTKLFPGIRVIRMDMDTTSEKGSHEKLLEQFRSKKADILLGTQMIAKGLDFPNIGLVGVINADSALHLPDFRSSERTFQLLTQVSGRAGRHEVKGTAIVQTYTPEHVAIQSASAYQYISFIEQELMYRKARMYPPYAPMISILFSHPDMIKTLRLSQNFINRMREVCASYRVEILGPAPAPIPKIKNKYRFQSIIKNIEHCALEPMISKVNQEFYELFQKEELQMSIDVNPYMLM